MKTYKYEVSDHHFCYRNDYTRHGFRNRNNQVFGYRYKSIPKGLWLTIIKEPRLDL